MIELKKMEEVINRGEKGRREKKWIGSTRPQHSHSISATA
jgi:hypothetical protein